MHARSFRSAFLVIGCLAAACFSGCAGNSKIASGPVFFPPAPNLPRLQYLTGISSSDDVKGVKDTVTIFDTGKVEERPATIRKPSAIASHKGKLYVTDLAGELYVIDLPQKRMESYHGNSGMGKLKKPVGIAVDEAGFVFVADRGRKEVLIYDDKGEYLKSLTASEMDPTDVVVDDSKVYVLDTRRAAIRVFDPLTNVQLNEIGRGGDPDRSLNLPTKMTLDKQGVLHVSSAGTGSIMSFDRDGHFLGSFGQSGDGLGQFARPKGVATDDNGYIYVVDAGFQNVQVFNDKGRLLTYFGSPKLPVGGMNLPCDITISSDDLPFYQKLAEKDFEVSEVIFVINQFGTPKISAYGFGKRKGIDYEKVYEEAARTREEKAREGLMRRKALTQEMSDQPATAKP